MSSIPFNTVTSVLGAGTVAGQVASIQDKKIQEQIRGQRRLEAATRSSQEEVDDPGGHDVQHVHDEDGGKPQDQNPRRRSTQEQVDIEGIQTASDPSTPPPAPSLGLDISA